MSRLPRVPNLTATHAVAVKKRFREKLRAQGLDVHVRLGRFVTTEPSFWYIENDPSGARYVLWTKKAPSEVLEDSHGMKRVKERINLKKRVGWPLTKFDVDARRFYETGVRPTINLLGERKGLIDNKLSDERKWGLHGDMVVRHYDLKKRLMNVNNE
ncbi:hypothetical protein TRVA0_003S03554 [Trichomonascus vanleenenianus]|uniref:uncharacterized protein n=1 Tax=Trichomonascus vanleenenianus TaxID=2268995 RepID=UPI003EC9EFC9